jgi:type III pantothenate kinase
MLLVIEVGNTNTKVGVFDGSRLLVSWRLTTRREQTADEYGVFIQTLLATRGIEPPRVTGVAISNVVPPVQQALESMSEAYFGIPAFSVEPGYRDVVPLVVDAPNEVGADRVCDIVGGVTLYGKPLIVINLGTATTFDCVNARGEFVGGAIAPGMITASEALISRAARLYRVELLQPKEAIGRNTVTNIQSGVVYGWAGLVDGVVERMRSEMGAHVKVVATGGLAERMRGISRCIDVVDSDLTIQGLRIIWELAHPTNVR